MSLINDALKKAQKQRTGETDSTPAASGDPGPRTVRRGKPAGPSSALVLGGIGLAAVVVVGAAVFFTRRPAAESAPATPATMTPVPATQPAASQAPVAQASAPKPAEVAPQPVVQAPVIAPPVQKPVVAVAPPKAEPAQPKTEPPAAPVVTTTVVSAPVITIPASDPARATAPGKLEPRAITFIESIRVAGIRASGSDRKVLMNDRVYRLGDLVEPEMGLTLVGIAFNALTFQDEKGAKYTRNF
jgi:hypothetical protein